MLLPEHLGKRLLAGSGLPVPPGQLVGSPAAVRSAVDVVGVPAVVKVQVPAGGRGKAGGVRLVQTEADAVRVADELLGSVFGGHVVTELLVERAIAHEAEHYLAVTDDPMRRTPVLLCAARGGVDVEDLERAEPGSVRSLAVSARSAPDVGSVIGLVRDAGITEGEDAVAETLVAMWRCYRDNDAELVEVNPLAVDDRGAVWALDAKCVLDEAALGRHEDLGRLVEECPPPAREGLEARAAARGFLLVSLGGSIGVVANGAGLTMATLDTVHHFGGTVASCIEIGGDNYTKGADAIGLLLEDGGVKSLLVNLCGAFARTDVMVAGILDGLAGRADQLPMAFAIAGTGSAEARTLVHERLGVTPAPTMDLAIQQAIAAAGAGS